MFKHCTSSRNITLHRFQRNDLVEIRLNCKRQIQKERERNGKKQEKTKRICNIKNRKKERERKKERKKEKRKKERKKERKKKRKRERKKLRKKERKRVSKKERKKGN